MVDSYELSYFAAMMTYEMPGIMEFTAKINSHLMDRFGYRTPLGKENADRRIYINQPKTRLYIQHRFKGECWENETLVIAEFGFNEENKEHSTDFLKFLYEQCEYYGIEYIGIEHANGKSKAFASKFGFHEIVEKEQFLIQVSNLKSHFINTF